MIVVCPTCQARFQYDEARFSGAESKRFRCPKCSTVFEVRNPALTAVPPRFVEFPGGAPKAAPPALPLPEPFLPPPPPLPSAASSVPWEEAPQVPTAGRETTARKDREAMLAAAGITAMPHGMRFGLAYLTGPLSGSVKLLETPQTFIGREEGDVVTRDPETSRRHARVDIHSDGTVWLTDLASTNGTFLEGIQIFGQVELQDRQEFTCGKSTFMLLIRKEDHLSMD